MRNSYVCALLCLVLAHGSSLSADTSVDLEPVYEDFLENADLLLSKKEVEVFLALEKTHQKDAFIERFWAARDPYPHTERNEFRIEWMGRLDVVRDRYGELDDPRSKLYLLNGDPSRKIETHCSDQLRPIEAWYYDHARSDRTASPFFVIFYRVTTRARPRLWRPTDGYAVLFKNPPEAFRSIQGAGASNQAYMAAEEIRKRCTELDPMGQFLQQALYIIVEYEGVVGYQALLATALSPPPAQEGHWLSDFRTTTTDLSPDTESLTATLRWASVGSSGSWESVDGSIELIPSELGVGDDGEAHLELFGEIFLEDRLHDSFRYRFDLSGDDLRGDLLPISIRRRLRPGLYEAVLRVVDQGSNRQARLVGPFEVESTARHSIDSEPNDSSPASKASFRLIPPEGESLTGNLRILAETELANIKKVRFLLDGKAILIKTRPPYSVSMDLGTLPIPHIVEAEALDAQGQRLGGDLLEINPEPHRFSVRIQGEVVGEGARRSLEVIAAVSAPTGEKISRLELFRESERIAVLYQPPWTVFAPLIGGETPAWVRAVAHLEDGRWVEQLALLEGDQLSEHLDVQLVELFATVVDQGQRPIRGLDVSQFQVIENGKPQTLVRFDQVDDLPIHVALVLDDSASMLKRLPVARQAAAGFLDGILRPGDRAAVVSFSHQPRLLAEFTDDPTLLKRALGELHASGETAMHDAVVFSLRAFGGLQGQRALLLISDGKDRSSLRTFDEALEYARRSGVAIYTVGLSVPFSERLARSHLERLAEATGGLHFLIEEVSELAAIYDQIERDLRSRYLLAYQSDATTGDDVFRPVQVRVEGAHLRVRTSAGYFP